MAGNFTLPPMGYGPGSQPSEADGSELDYLPMPQDMRSYSAHIPEMEAGEALTPALDLLRAIAKAAGAAGTGCANQRFDLSGLDTSNRALMAETLGEGEVAIRIHGADPIAIQESVFTGVWALKGAGLDAVEVGPVPEAAMTHAFTPQRPGEGANLAPFAGVMNAQPLMAELADKSASYRAGEEVHTVNLSLLPHTEEDLAWLDRALGQGSVDILSRGYGNCRIAATGLSHVWRVQFFNSTDILILDTFEVCAMPVVAIAAPEDLADSEARILDVLEAIS